MFSIIALFGSLLKTRYLFSNKFSISYLFYVVFFPFYNMDDFSYYIISVDIFIQIRSTYFLVLQKS